MKDIFEEFGGLMDVKRFLVDLIHDGINNRASMAESLADALADKYENADPDEIETMAKLYVEEMADDAEFIAEAEDEEAAADYRDMVWDYQTAQGWVC